MIEFFFDKTELIERKVQMEEPIAIVAPAETLTFVGTCFFLVKVVSS